MPENISRLEEVFNSALYRMSPLEYRRLNYKEEGG